MRTIIFTNLDKVDRYSTTANIDIVETVDEMKNKNGLFVMDEANFNFNAMETDEVCIPSIFLKEGANPNVYVYFELEQFPFFQKVKESIAKGKGVLRFKRTTDKTRDDKLMASDLLVFASLLGEPQDLRVKRTNQDTTPYHVILMVNFGNGRMAHLEYTFSDMKEVIELEWSGIKQIIEFNSDEMKPLNPKSCTSLPLAYSADSILNNAKKVDQKLVNRMQNFIGMISGGANG